MSASKRALVSLRCSSAERSDGFTSSAKSCSAKTADTDTSERHTASCCACAMRSLLLSRFAVTTW